MEPPECPVCLQPFDGEATIPRVLACGHSACDSCLTHLPKPPFTRTIRCPACTQLVTYPESPSALPKNIDLLRISSSLNPKPKLNSSSPTLPLLDFIPDLWSHAFFNNWKDWITPHNTISIDESTPVNGSSLVYGKAVNLKVPARCSMKCRMNVSLFKVGSSTGNDENGFRYSYLAKAMWVLFKLGDGVLAELELMLRSGLMDRRVCGVCGLWYDEEDDCLYLVCERKRTSLLNVVGLYTEVDLSSFAVMGMELCETVSRLHDVELVTGCVSLSCFGVDHFGHVFLDVNEVLMIGERVREMIRESVSFAQSNSDGKTLASNVISEIHVFPSPELSIEFVRKECVVDLECQKSTFAVGYSSDLWSLACILLMFLVGKPFVEETCDFMCSYVLKLVNGNACDCEGLHVAWLDKVSSLLYKKLDSNYVLMKELLCKCLSLDPGTRPTVNDMWKCMRELIISPKCDVIVSIERETISGSACHCLLLGDLLWSSSKTNKVEDKKGMSNDLKDENLVVKGDVIEGICKNSLTCTDLKGHLDCISGLAIGGGFLFSASFDKTINVWSLEGLNHVHTLKGHEHKVMALVFVEREVPLCISGDNGGDVFIWAIVDEKPKQFKRLTEEKDWRYSGIHALATVSGSDFFYTGSGDKSVKAWSMHDYSVSCTMNGHKSVVCTLAVCNGVLYSGSWDGTVRLWCLSDHSPLAVLGENTSTCGSVLSLAAHTHTLVAAHESGHMKAEKTKTILKIYLRTFIRLHFY
ncbi:uncharacterized protein LOC143555465 [Bidens hawaiensis]|uniref:uncharacterized protein LOC143555465 n=1 Tax=Bidens hawaiensis TaxID=980011 RepID=UPI004049DDA1